jgi:hypothetical protein
VQQTNEVIADLLRQQQRVKRREEEETERRKLLSIWSNARLHLLQRGDVPHSVTVRMGELVKMLNRAPIEVCLTISTELQKITAKYERNK